MVCYLVTSCSWPRNAGRPLVRSVRFAPSFEHGSSDKSEWLQGHPPGEADFFDRRGGLDALAALRMVFHMIEPVLHSGFDFKMGWDRCPQRSVEGE